MLTTIETLDQLQRGTEPIIYFSRYRSDRVDNGGARRTAQLRQLLAGYDVAFVSSLTSQSPVTDESARKRDTLFDRVVRIVVRCSTRKYSAEFGYWLFFSDRLARRWVKALQKRSKPRLIFVDDPIFFPSLVSFCAERKIPVIAHCHNIETLSRGQVMPPYQQELFVRELALLAQCQAAVTISHEEAFLLRNLGISAVYLPYYPPASVEEQLLAVRGRRDVTAVRDFLVLGSVTNVPTRTGVMRLLAAWQQLDDHPKERLVVAGYGTEELRDLSVMGVDFCGAVTNEELAELLVKTRAAIVYQEEGSGALTRIGELLLAGVPVVANHHAARSWHHLPGVIEFDDLSALSSTLTTLLTAPPGVLSPPAPAASELLRLIDTIIGGD